MLWSYHRPLLPLETGYNCHHHHGHHPSITGVFESLLLPTTSFSFKIWVGASDWQNPAHVSKPRLQRWLRNRLCDLFSFNSGEWALPLNVGDSPNTGRMFRCWMARNCTPSLQPLRTSLVSIAWMNQHPLIHLSLGHRQISEAYKLEDQEVDSWETSRMEAIQFILPCQYSLLVARWHFFPLQNS